MAAGDIDALVTGVAGQGALDRKVSALLAGLADQLRATSNDQNVQALARELRAATPQIVEAMVAEDGA